MRKVCIIAYYTHISLSGRTTRGLVRKDLVDFQTGEVLRSGKRSYALRDYAEKQGWCLVMPNHELLRKDSAK